MFLSPYDLDIQDQGRSLRVVWINVENFEVMSTTLDRDAGQVINIQVDVEQRRQLGGNVPQRNLPNGLFVYSPINDL